MLAHLTHAVQTAWHDLPEPDKGIVTAAALVYGTILAVLTSGLVLAVT